MDSPWNFPRRSARGLDGARLASRARPYAAGHAQSVRLAGRRAGRDLRHISHPIYRRARSGAAGAVAGDQRLRHRHDARTAVESRQILRRPSIADRHRAVADGDRYFLRRRSRCYRRRCIEWIGKAPEISARTSRKNSTFSISRCRPCSDLRNAILPKNEKVDVGVDIVSFVQPAISFVTPADRPGLHLFRHAVLLPARTLRGCGTRWSRNSTTTTPACAR